MFTASSSNPWVFIPAVVVMAALLVLRWYYLKTSRAVKRLEAIGDYAATYVRVGGSTELIIIISITYSNHQTECLH